MKNLKIYFVFLLFLTAGCEKYIDKSDEIALSEEDVFSRYEGVRGYLDKTYRALLDIHMWNSNALPRTHISSISDEAHANMSSNPNDMSRVINTGNWLNQPAVGEIGYNSNDNAIIGETQAPVMDNAYLCLRIANKVIEQASTVPGLTSQQLDELLGQAYFMRGWWYFQLISRVGGLPLYDKAYTGNDNLDVPRLTYAESNEFVISNMNEAIARLPHVWDLNNTGRATKAAAMAVKSMAMLYAASPLMQNNLTSTVNNGYSIEKAERAAQYANDVIKYVQSKTGGSDYRLMPGSEYKNIFYHTLNASPEEIWYNMDAGGRVADRSIRVFFLPQSYAVGTGNDATAFTGPTQNSVEWYEKINNGQAYPITDPRANYDPQNPYIDRDPRLYNNVIVPGERWGLLANNNPSYSELYVGGRDDLNVAAINHTRTKSHAGYLTKKFIWESANAVGGQYALYKFNTCYIRLAQVYLDYAEAMNEAYGPASDPKGYGLTAEGALNLIRNRVGMPNVLPEFAGSKERLRDRIRNERAVELFFENHRWHDLRRWMIAEEVLKTPIKGIRATPASSPVHTSVANKSTLKFTYNVINMVTEQRVFQTKHYWYPVDQNQVNSQFNYVQNPGW